MSVIFFNPDIYFGINKHEEGLHQIRLWEILDSSVLQFSLGLKNTKKL
jgi:hypothetical protein